MRASSNANNPHHADAPDVIYECIMNIVESAALKLRPYGAILICSLLLFFTMVSAGCVPDGAVCCCVHSVAMSHVTSHAGGGDRGVIRQLQVLPASWYAAASSTAAPIADTLSSSYLSPASSSTSSATAANSDLDRGRSLACTSSSSSAVVSDADRRRCDAARLRQSASTRPSCLAGCRTKFHDITRPSTDSALTRCWNQPPVDSAPYLPPPVSVRRYPPLNGLPPPLPPPPPPEMVYRGVSPQRGSGPSGGTWLFHADPAVRGACVACDYIRHSVRLQRYEPYTTRRRYDSRPTSTRNLFTAREPS